MNFIKLFITIIFLIFIPCNAWAVSGDARSMGMGDTNTATSGGIGAVYWNPANLAGHKGISVGFLQGGFNFGNNVVSIQNLSEVLWANTTLDKNIAYEKIIQATPLTGLQGSFTMNSLEGVAYDNYAISFGVQGYGGGNLSKDAVSYLLRQDVFVFRKIWWNLDVSGYGEANVLASPILTAAYNIPWLGMDVGIDVKPYTNGYYIKGNADVTALWVGGTTAPYKFLTNKATVFTSSRPSGIGIDIGVSKNLSDNLRISAAVQNIGGDITWQGTQEVKSASTSLPPGSMFPTFAILTVATPAQMTVRQNLTGRVGIMYHVEDLSGPVVLALDYEAATFTRSGFHAGIEKYIGPYAIRAGLTPNPYSSHTMLTLGIGMKIWNSSVDFSETIENNTNTGMAINVTSDF